MPQLEFTRKVAFSPDLMLKLVADLKSYPDFIPNCSGMGVRNGEDNCQLALMEISFGPILQSYTSRVDIDEKLLTISAEAIDGPFSHLISKWTFLPDGAGTKISFEIDFQIANPMIAAIAEPAFAKKQEEILDAFIDEAQRRYG